MKCPICKSEGNEFEISDAKIREDHAKTHDATMTGADLELLAQPSSAYTIADALPGLKK